MEYCQRLLGKDASQAAHVANELVMDLQTGTDYPPTIRPMVAPEVLAGDIRNMVAAIKLKKMKLELKKINIHN